MLIQHPYAFFGGLPWWLSRNNPPAKAADTDLIPGSERSPGGGNGKSTPVFLPGESHRQRSLRATVHGVAQSDMTEAT